MSGIRMRDLPNFEHGDLPVPSGDRSEGRQLLAAAGLDSVLTHWLVTLVSRENEGQLGRIS